MPAPRTLHPQAVDALTQTGALVVGLAPGMAMASLYQTLANATATAAMNAVYAQQQAYIVHQAATAKAVAMLLAALDEP